jgi:hypothetical protein
LCQDDLFSLMRSMFRDARMDPEDAVSVLTEAPAPEAHHNNHLPNLTMAEPR